MCLSPLGEIPELFSEEEIEGIVAGVRSEVRALGMLDSKENCWRFFIDRVRLQLTVPPFIFSESQRHPLELLSGSF